MTPDEIANVLGNADAFMARVKAGDAHADDFPPGAIPGLVSALSKAVRQLGQEQADLDEQFPCDGFCSNDDGPQEDCSRHGRPPRWLWTELCAGYAKLNALDAWLREARFERHGHAPEEIRAILYPSPAPAITDNEVGF